MPALTPSRALKLVAWTFLIPGAYAAVVMVFELVGKQNIHINLGALGIPIGLGLLHREPRALGWATAYLGIACAIGFFVFAASAMFAGDVVKVRFFTTPETTATRALFVTSVGAFLVANLSLLRILERRDVAALFSRQSGRIA